MRPRSTDSRQPAASAATEASARASRIAARLYGRVAAGRTARYAESPQGEVRGKCRDRSREVTRELPFRQPQTAAGGGGDTPPGISPVSGQLRWRARTAHHERARER